jgi:hypothetical protein
MPTALSRLMCLLLSLRGCVGSPITMFVQNYLKIVDVFTALKILTVVFEIMIHRGINISEERASPVFEAIS